MAGKLVFAPIPRLPANWMSRPETVWTVWSRDDYYLWGANSGNMFLNQGMDLQGGGLAGKKHGPTRGYAHDHYIGVNTMQFDRVFDNNTVFIRLIMLIRQEKNIIIPIYDEDGIVPPTFKYSLGTGIGSGVPRWLDIQKHLLKHIIDLSEHVSSIEIPDDVYWPDCRQKQPYPRYRIQSIDDIRSIVDQVN